MISIIKNYSKIFLETFVKDFKIFISYKLASFSFIFLIIANVFLFYYFSMIVNVNDDSYIVNSNYFIYVIYGISVTEFTILCINRIPNEIRNFQLTGVIENIFNSNSSIIFVLISSTAFPLFLGVFKMFLYFLIAKLMFDVEIIIYENIYRYLVIILIYYLFLISFGMIGGAYTILFKKGNPVTSIYIFLAAGFAETFIPINVFPNILIHLSNFIPTKKILGLLRQLENKVMNSGFFDELLMIGMYNSLIFIFGVVLLNYAIKIAKSNGSLIHY
jgi:hypothetical protein